MSILRSDEQVDGQEILKSIIETADFYRAMAELLAEENLYGRLLDLAKERKAYIKPFQKVVALLDELPAMPDPEKEQMQQFASKITKLISSESKNALLDKCLHKDEELAELISHTTLRKQSLEFKTLLDSLSNNLSGSIQTLLALKD